jgi:hypothetical protein
LDQCCGSVTFVITDPDLRIRTTDFRILIGLRILFFCQWITRSPFTFMRFQFQDGSRFDPRFRDQENWKSWNLHTP